jgi:SPX domain protein involved in polyphosphate accumulation
MASRYELKYFLTEDMALRVRDFILQYLEFDEYCMKSATNSYPVHSLYLDSDDWKIYWRTINGDKNRYKLRVRYYSEHPKSPIFFEIKRRMKDIILKERCGVRREAVPQVLAGQIPTDDQVTTHEPEDQVAMVEFIRLMADVNAKPKMHVAYMREAFVNNYNNEVRVTMDRTIRMQPRPGGEIVTTMENPIKVSEKLVVLELKFSGRFPHYYREVVQKFNLPLTGAAKYVEGTTLYMGRDQPIIDVMKNMF